MNGSLGFAGRTREAKQIATLYKQRKHVLLVGPAGIGKTALLRHVRQSCPLLHCEETSSLRRICDGLERQLGWTHYKLNVIERKNRLLACLARRGEPVAFDHVALTPPRVSRFIGTLGECIPVWILCRCDQPRAIGHLWEQLCKFVRIELRPLTRADTRGLIDSALKDHNIQANARDHAMEIHRLSAGNPRKLEELLIELAAREYKIDSPFGIDLLDLDRRIHQVAIEASVAAV